MNQTITGIHHVTAIASDPQQNVDFYAGLLGLRWIKRTVNFDDPTAYHLYYGDESGSPGTVVTFFYWPKGSGEGRIGTGQMTAFSFSVAQSSFDYWEDRLNTHGVSYERFDRFEEAVLRFEDPDGIPIEFISGAEDHRRGWDQGGIPSEHVLRGFYTAELTVSDMAPTQKLLTEHMGFRVKESTNDRVRLEAGKGEPGSYVDIVKGAGLPRGSGGSGTFHHIAFSIPDEDSQRQKRLELQAAGLRVTEVINRDYFRSIYFREFGGILFEIATAGPGFTIDEPLEALGTSLKLPQMHEADREKIENSLPPLSPPR